MRGARIDYGGVAVGAKESFMPSTTEAAKFSDLSQLQRDGLTFKNIVNPCELYSTVLDGSAIPLPSDTTNVNIGWWSEQISGEDGTFAQPIEITFVADEVFTSSGITLSFDAQNNTFANYLNIKWYNGDTLLSSMDFYPDTFFYFCPNKVEYYNKVVINFYKLNMPYNRLKVRAIEYGMKITFYGNELRNVSLAQEVDAISSKIPINTGNIVIDSHRNIDYTFQKRQPLTVYFDENLHATLFVKTANRQSKTLWSVQAEDYVGILDNIPFAGGIYKDKNAIDLINEISEVSKIPFDISNDFADEVVTGYIPYTTCRNALSQVAFVIGAIVDTSYSAMVRVYKISNEISQEIPLKRIMQGQTFKDETEITAIDVTAYKYTSIDEDMTAYDAFELGEGEGILVKFNEPLHDLKITNGEIIESGANYAIINIQAGGVLEGKKYLRTTKTKRKQNPNVLRTDTDRIISVSQAYLVSENILDNMLDICYNYYKQNNSVASLKIVDGKREKELAPVVYGTHKYGEFVYGTGAKLGEIEYDTPTRIGDVIVCATEYLGDIQGLIVKQSYTLNGGILVKNTELRRYD